MTPGERSTGRTAIRFRLLGPVVIETDGGLLTPTRRQERCLLAILLLERGRVVPMERLCDLLWDGEPPERAYQAVRSQVAHLRSLLARADRRGDMSIVSDPRGFALKVPAEVVDAHQFRALVDRARTASPFLRDRLLRDALELWRGPALHNAAPDRTRHRLCVELEELRLHAIEESMATGLALGRSAELVPQLTSLSAEHPERERLVELCMSALYREGRAAEAVEVYRRTRDRLAREMGVDPGPSLQHLHQAVLRGDQLHSQEPPPARPPAIDRFAPALLPADLPGFAGRTTYLDELDALLASKATAVVISAIAGTPGVGKTALAVHWAHSVRHLFPDGQLYVDLRGFDPDCTPTSPAEVIRRFLGALQVPAYRIPGSLDAQADLYRSLLADRHVLILLDNARDADQVRPLLPGAPGCLTLVTSRNLLTGLVAVDGAHPLALDLVTTDEARELLAARLGADRLAAEATAADQLIERCARLPLALSIAAAHAATRADLSLADLVTNLDDVRAALDVLTGDDTATDLRAVFSCSYNALSADAARLFRLLALHPGPEIGAPAAASLAAVPVVHVELLLTELTHAHLLSERTRGRFGFHDLLRVYATEQANRYETTADRRCAARRVLDYYLHTAHCAAALLQARGSIVPAPPEPQFTHPPFADRKQALDWLAAERSVLVAAVHRAAQCGFDRHAWQLADSLADFLQRRGDWHARASVDRAALDAARRLADLRGQADVNRRLATVYAGLGRHDDAQAYARRALDLYAELTDPAGQARTHWSLSWVFVKQGRTDLALRHAQRAHDLYRTIGDRAGEAAALNNIGWDHALLGDYQRCLVACQQALTLFQDIDDRHGQALSWDSLGYANHHLGMYQQAVTGYQHALDLFRELGDRYNEAMTLTNLGDTLQAVGDISAASQARQQAQSILDDQKRSHADALYTP